MYPKFLQQFSPSIKNIIFDLGGVILNVDYHHTINAFVDMGITNFAELYTQAQQCSLFDNMDRGTISPANFRNAVRQMNPSLSLTDDQIDGAWNAMLCDMPAVRLDVLLALKPHFRTFLLSNTNAIHVPLFSGIVQQVVGKNDLSEFFEKTYYSNEIGMRKPDAEIFEFVLAQNNLNANETLFIDDSLQHIEGARKVGLHAYHLIGKETISELFSDTLEKSLAK